MARISLEGLTKRFGPTEVVSDVSLEIADGEFVVVVGPSGCGKSTTLRLLAGLEEASEGVIAFDGRPVQDLAPADRNIAMVFQSYALYPHMTVAENLGFGLRQRRVPRAEVSAKVGRAAELLGIADLLGRRPRELSGGQRQRVAMGRAIVRDPSVFLFDEPLSNLDTALRTQMRIEIKRLHRQLRTTVVYVTHDQVEAMTLADRIVVMDRGRIIQVGDPASIYEHPATRFVASFIGSPPMSFVPGHIVRADRGLALALGHAGGESGLLQLPPRLAAMAQPFVGQAIEIGLRPEHVSEGHREGSGQETVEGDVELVERLGADTLVFLSVNGTKLTARGRPNGSSRAGTRCPFTIDMEHALLIQSNGQVLASEPPSIGDGRSGGPT